MKLNLGCGKDIKPGYVNVDFIDYPGVDRVVDLGKFPWPFEDGAADEIIMLDFLEHFSYRQTDSILREAWRVLKPGGTIDVQVPDLEHCAAAAANDVECGYLCNMCGHEMMHKDITSKKCLGCGRSLADIQDAAIHRLYGGQDREGNWHHTAFTREILQRILKTNGFDDIVQLDGVYQWANWNFKFRATKKGDLW